MGMRCCAQMNGYMFKTGIPLPHAKSWIPKERVVKGEGLSLDCLPNFKLLLKVPQNPTPQRACASDPLRETPVFEESPQASLLAQMVKSLQCRRPGFSPWVGKVPWRRERLPTPVFLPGGSHGQRSLVGCRPGGRKESDPPERLSTSVNTECDPT